ncbi:MAG: FAD/NAD(P)-binding protein [Armatimonadota bacterium]|nr:MAG: FAD/NAD(P)-binding protein [Armatimonadota bacterium]
MGSGVEAGLYVPEIATIVGARDLTWQDRVFVVELAGGRSLGHRPGQFVQLSVFGFGEAPISVCSPPEKAGSFDLCVRKLGGLTKALHGLGPGDEVGIRGPFGNGFPMKAMRGMDCLIVAGGIGLAPLRSVIDSIFLNRSEYGRLILLYGTRSPRDILFPEELEAWSADPRNEVLVTVDEASEGWGGHAGVVTTLFPRVTIDPVRTVVVALVGPPVMYRFVMAELEAMGVPEDHMFFSLERRMRCGVGKCGHCQVDGRCVCVDGPVFSAREIKTMKESV